MLAGIPVRDQDVLELARLLRDAGFDDTAETLEDAYDKEVAVVALTISDREGILRVLDDPNEGLAEASRRNSSAHYDTRAGSARSLSHSSSSTRVGCFSGER